MAIRFWVGGTGTWSSSDTSHWAASSGGAPGASVPGASDNVNFDANSGTGTVTINYSPSIIAFNSANSTLTFSGTNGLTASGNVTLGSGNTYSVTGTLTATGNCTFTSNGKSWAGDVTFNGASKFFQLGDDFSLAGDKILTLLAGSLLPLTHNITVGRFASTGTGTCSINTLSSAGTVINLIPSTSGTAACWWITNTNFSYSQSTETTIKVEPTFVGSGMQIRAPVSGTLTMPKLWIHQTGAAASNAIEFGGNQTYAYDFIDDGTTAHTLRFSLATFTFNGAFNVNGITGQVISIESVSSGTPATFSKSSGTVSVDYLDIKDNTATGGATWNAGVHSTDSGGNTGWNFASSAANIAPSLYTNTNTFYSTVVMPAVWTISPSRYNNTNTFYTAVIHTTVGITPTLYTNTNTFYTAVVVSGIGPTLFVNTNTFYTAIVGRGAVGITPSLYTNTNTFFTAVVRNVKRITPLIYNNTNTFFTAVVAPGAASITPTLYTNANTFYTAVLTGGIQAGHINPTLYQNTNTFYTATVRSTSKITPVLYQNTNTFYTAVRTSTVNVSPSLFQNTNTFFTPVLTTSAHNISPSLVVNTQTFYNPVLSWITKQNSQSFIIGLG